MADESNEYIYAGFWRRYAAVFLDAVLALGIFLSALLVAGAIGIFDSSLFFANYIVQAQSGYIDYSQNPLLWSNYFIFLIFYLVVTMSLYGATPGKRFLGIAVISKTDHLRIGIIRSFFRFILYFISSMLLLPFLTQLFTKKRQTLYDLMVKTIVIKGKFVNGELTETEDVFTKKWLVFLLSIAWLLIPILFIVVAIPAYYGYMEAKQNQADAMQDSIQNQPLEISEQQSSQSQSIGDSENKFIDDNYAIIGIDENSTTHYIKTYSIKDLDNDKREAIFKLNMPSIDASSKIKQVIDCKNFKIQTIEGEIFEQQHLKGSSTFVPNASEKNAKAILGNSLDMKKYAAVCGGQVFSALALPGFNLPDTSLGIVDSSKGDPQFYRKGYKYRPWFVLTIQSGSKNNDEFKNYSLFNEINCKTSSVTPLLITEFEGTANRNTDKYKTSSITTGQINNTMTAMNKKIPKTTELVKKAIISYFCSASN